MFPFTLLPKELQFQILNRLGVSERLKCIGSSKFLRGNVGVLGLLPSRLRSVTIECKLYGKLTIRLFEQDLTMTELRRSAIYEAFEDSPQIEVRIDQKRDTYCFPLCVAETILEIWENRARVGKLIIFAEEAFVETIDCIAIRRTNFLKHTDNLEIHFKFLSVLKACTDLLSNIPNQIQIIWSSYIEGIDQSEDLEQIYTIVNLLATNQAKTLNVFVKSSDNHCISKYNTH